MLLTNNVVCELMEEYDEVEDWPEPYRGEYIIFTKNWEDEAKEIEKILTPITEPELREMALDLFVVFNRMLKHVTLHDEQTEEDALVFVFNGVTETLRIVIRGIENVIPYIDEEEYNIQLEEGYIAPKILQFLKAHNERKSTSSSFS